jgi:arylsulfatase A-like enzyme
VNLVDLAPTLLELVGGAPDPGWQGRSLAGALRSPDELPARAPGGADAAVFLQNGDLRGLATRRWKLVDAAGAAELYDLAEDPWERVDLGASPAHARTVAELRARLAAARRRALDDERLP